MHRDLLLELAAHHLLLEASQVLQDLVEEVNAFLKLCLTISANLNSQDPLLDSLRSQDSNSHPDPHHQDLPHHEDELTEDEEFYKRVRQVKYDCGGAQYRR
jgi:hypothetical protein